MSVKSLLEKANKAADDVDGVFVSGEHKRRSFMAFSDDELMAIAQESEGESRTVIEAYLSYRKKTPKST